MGRSPSCENVGLNKGKWTFEEDQKLLTYIKEHGHGCWQALPAKAGLRRCGKSCRIRWNNYLRPDLKRGKFSLQEERTIIQLHALLGNRWSVMASLLPQRTNNEIKNYWNTHLKKRLTEMGIDPATHRLIKNNILDTGAPKETANLRHMAQWESARIEAEARLVRESRFLSTISGQSKTTFLFPCLDILKAWQRTRGTIVTTNGFFNSNGTLQSPTSILHYSADALKILRNDAACFSKKWGFPATNFVDNSRTCQAAGTTTVNVPEKDNHVVLEENGVNGKEINAA